MKVWITKHVLGEGIKEVDALVDENGNYSYKHNDSTTIRLMNFGAGVDWFFLYAPAKAKAEQMRQAKIASLKKQIAKLEKLEF